MKKRALIILTTLACIVALFIAFILSGRSSDPPAAIVYIVQTARNILDPRSRAAVADWKTPISFFGVVVDEAGSPVERADIEFLCNDLSPSGTSTYKRASDAKGRFSIDDISGKYLAIRVTKVGFYTSKHSPSGFFYAGGSTNFVADPAKPLTFRLKRKGVIARLVTRRALVKVPPDGTSIALTMLPPQTDVAGRWQIHARCEVGNKDPQTGRYEWKLHLTMPTGGIQMGASEFNFEAPADGYQQHLTVASEPPDSKIWQPSFEGNFFVTENGKYARMWIRFLSDNRVLRSESFVNPSGSRNLESAFEPQ